MTILNRLAVYLRPTIHCPRTPAAVHHKPAPDTQRSPVRWEEWSASIRHAPAFTARSAKSKSTRGAHAPRNQQCHSELWQQRALTQRRCQPKNRTAHACNCASRFHQRALCRAVQNLKSFARRSAVGEQIICSPMLLRFLPMRSGSQQCVNVVPRVAALSRR